MKLETLLKKEGITEAELKTIIKSSRSRPIKNVALEIPENNFSYLYFTDAHIGHNKFQYPLFNKMVKLCEKNKPDFAIDSGDHLEGMSNRAGHVYELTHIGFKNQIEEASKLYSKIPVQIYGIDGNHDDWYFKKADHGIVVGEELELRLTNYKTLGRMEGHLNVNGVEIMLFHANDGTAYANSYKLQKLVESLTGGEKPGIIHSGHYHKSLFQFTRNIHAFEGGTLCFRPQVAITTSKGKKEICKIKKGDLVLTHTNTFKRVIKVIKRKTQDKFIRISIRQNDLASSLCGTENHPILIERKGIKKWLPLNQILIGDLVFITASNCKHCQKLIPNYNVFCPECTPMNTMETRTKLSNIRGPLVRKYKQFGSGWKHLTKDIIPFCEKKIKDGWKMVPVGAGTIPDIVGFKDGKVVLFELESKQGLALERKQNKYVDSPITKFVDNVEWVNLKNKFSNATQIRYSIDVSGFIKIPVSCIKHLRNNQKICTVYNLEVEEDNSYVASNFVVHNCGQSEWMRGKKIAANMGFGFVTVYHGDDGSVDRLIHEWVAGYEPIRNSYKITLGKGDN